MKLIYVVTTNPPLFVSTSKEATLRYASQASVQFVQVTTWSVETSDSNEDKKMDLIYIVTAITDKMFINLFVTRFEDTALQYAAQEDQVTSDFEFVRVEVWNLNTGKHLKTLKPNGEVI